MEYDNGLQASNCELDRRYRERSEYFNILTFSNHRYYFNRLNQRYHPSAPAYINRMYTHTQKLKIRKYIGYTGYGFVNTVVQSK